MKKPAKEITAGTAVMAQAVAVGMTAGMTKLFVAHAEVLGGNEEAVLKTREIVDSSLDELSISAETRGVEADKGIAELRKRISDMVQIAENAARRHFGLDRAGR